MRPFRLSFFLLALFVAVFTSCNKKLYLQQQSDRYYVINNSVGTDSNLLTLLAPYKIGVDTQMQVVIGHTDIPLTKAQPESTLGNFMADAQLAAAKRLDHKVVASVVNYGGIRLPYLPAGNITRGMIYELMPFDNMLTLIEVPGEVVKQFCNHMAKARGWPVSGISYTIKDKAATDITINGKTLNDHIIYTIAVSDYIAKGGDNCDFLVPLQKRYTTVFVRDAMINYVTKLEQLRKPLHPQLENRVRYAE